MNDMVVQIKETIGYTETPNKCKDCVSFQEDTSGNFGPDNFGPGDLCVRNPDVPFLVRSTAVCNKWKSKAI
jgi:hypothetical protein